MSEEQRSLTELVENTEGEVAIGPVIDVAELACIVEAALLASIVLAGSSVPRAIRVQKPLPIGLSVLALFGLYNFGTAFANKR